MTEPPPDPEDWTVEQWLEWLEATDSPEADSSGDDRSVPRRARRAQSVLGAAMLGLRDAIYGRPDDEAVIIAEGPGDPPDDDHLVVHLDPEHPERSQVVLPRRPSPKRDP